MLGNRKLTKLDRRINHVQTGLKADAKLNKNRSFVEFTELTFLIADQFDDQNKHTIKKDV